MKEGLRFVDSDMHIQEPGDLFEKYLDPAFKSRVTRAVGADGKLSHRSWIIDGLPASMDVELQQHRKKPASSRASGLSLISRNGMDPQLSLALSQAYNNWIHEFCQYSPNQLKFASMLPLHDVNLACQELLRCVRELGAVASFIRPNLLNGHYWHSNY